MFSSPHRGLVSSRASPVRADVAYNQPCLSFHVPGVEHSLSVERRRLYQAPSSASAGICWLTASRTAADGCATHDLRAKADKFCRPITISAATQFWAGCRTPRSASDMSHPYPLNLRATSSEIRLRRPVPNTIAAVIQQSPGDRCNTCGPSQTD